MTAVSVAAAALGLSRYLVDDDTAAWARTITSRLVPAGTDLPVYGSDEWAAASDQVRLASALRAAEVHRRDVLFAEDDVADQLRGRRVLVEEIDADEFAAIAAGVRALARTPDHTELVARRAQNSQQVWTPARGWVWGPASDDAEQDDRAGEESSSPASVTGTNRADAHGQAA